MGLQRKVIVFENNQYPVYTMNTLVIGSGAAGLNAALRLHELGQADIALVTENRKAGTSRNAGSDKQTYCKLSLAGSRDDSPRRMAEDLYAGGCMHGDIALCEAQLSAQAFYNLVRLGVPFPHDRYGAYVGYKTDHDPAGRATSAGPLTSRYMCECLEQALKRNKVPLLGGIEVIALLWDLDEDGRRKACGAVALKRGKEPGFVLFNAKNIILATGGPGGMYETSVYPESQRGSTGMALAVGAAARNLTESQFGLASVKFRWNVSGSYQQVIPRYFSRGRRGTEEREFLADHFPDLRSLASAVFRKGYEWPFDASKIRNHGSSLIDLLVYRETVIEGRRVYLDYTRNPEGVEGWPGFSLEDLDKEARGYLESCGALRPTPIERLEAMNPQAAELFRAHGIDLAMNPLEIAVCAQHNNGGLKGDIWWESNIRHLFPVGEVNGSHGVRRPGGSALNAGQVGGMRAALYIAKRCGGPPMDSEAFLRRIGGQIKACLDFASDVAAPRSEDDAVTPAEAAAAIRRRMSAFGGPVRDPARVARARSDAWEMHETIRQRLSIRSPRELLQAFRVRDLCLTHAVYLEALHEYLQKGGLSRGSFVVLNSEGDEPCAGLGGEWRFASSKPGDFVNDKILEIRVDDEGGVKTSWVDIRPIPEEDGWFETLWSDYVKDRVIRKEEDSD